MAEFAHQTKILFVEAQVDPFAVSQTLNEKGPRVMPGLVVFGAWISQANDQLYGGHGGGPSLIARRVMTYSAAPSSFSTREAWMLATARSVPWARATSSTP